MEPKKILVIRFSSLGDVILTTGIFPNLKAAWPNCEVSVLTKRPFSPLFQNNPHVDHVHVYDPKEQLFSQLTKEIRLENFDLMIDLHSNIRSWFIRFISGSPIAAAIPKQMWARRKLVWFKKASPCLALSFRERVLSCLSHLGVPLISEETQLFPEHAQETLDSLSIPAGKTLIGLAPGAKHKTKQWTAEGFANVGNRFGGPNTEILLLGDKSDKETSQAVAKKLLVPYRDLTGWTSIPELMAVVSKLHLLITNDSGLLHMGEALRTPLVALFGPTVRKFGFAPYRATSKLVEVNDLECRPCTLHGDEVCPLGHHQCMTFLQENAVFEAGQLLLGMSSVTI